MYINICPIHTVIDECRGGSSGGIVQSYEDLVRNYVVGLYTCICMHVIMHNTVNVEILAVHLIWQFDD